MNYEISLVFVSIYSFSLLSFSSVSSCALLYRLCRACTTYTRSARLSTPISNLRTFCFVSPKTKFGVWPPTPSNRKGRASSYRALLVRSTWTQLGAANSVSKSWAVMQRCGKDQKGTVPLPRLKKWTFSASAHRSSENQIYSISVPW